MYFRVVTSDALFGIGRGVARRVLSERVEGRETAPPETGEDLRGIEDVTSRTFAGGDEIGQKKPEVQTMIMGTAKSLAVFTGDQRTMAVPNISAMALEGLDSGDRQRTRAGQVFVVICES